MDSNLSVRSFSPSPDARGNVAGDASLAALAGSRVDRSSARRSSETTPVTVHARRNSGDVSSGTDCVRAPAAPEGFIPFGDGFVGFMKDGALRVSHSSARTAYVYTIQGKDVPSLLGLLASERQSFRAGSVEKLPAMLVKGFTHAERFTFWLMTAKIAYTMEISNASGTIQQEAQAGSVYLRRV